MRSKLPVALLALATVAVLWIGHRALRETGPQPVEVLRSALTLQNGRLHRAGDTNAFSGLMIERYPDGALRSRSAVVDGLLEGLSEGWHTNGQLQVTEHFNGGVSSGLRTKWHPGGTKLSEAQIVDGKFEGTYRRWHENGRLAEQVDFVRGLPSGISLAWFASGRLKARVRLEAGQVVDQQFWPDTGVGPQ